MERLGRMVACPDCGTIAQAAGDRDGPPPFICPAEDCDTDEFPIGAALERDA